MPRKTRRKGPAKTAGVRTIRVTIDKAGKISSRDVERVIRGKLASTKTDVFGSNDALVILCEQHKRRNID
jgi:hypothetical protein